MGSVTIPFERGLIGHSDADAVYAVIEAILGAAARRYRSTLSRYRRGVGGTIQRRLLRRAVCLGRAKGFAVANVDVSVIDQRPKLAPYIDAMRARVADALSISIDQVSVKGKTNEGVGAIGRGEAIAAHAVALLRRARE